MGNDHIDPSERERHDVSVESSSGPAVDAYEPPQLRVLGDVATLTRGGAGDLADVGGLGSF